MKISIVTPTLNRGGMIEKAIHSVMAQQYENVEHIILDGGSTDDTLERLSRYPHLRVVSEPDRGLYDAYNKGVKLASGDVVGFLNDDDFYEAGVFERVTAAFAAPNRPLVVTGWSSGVRETPSGEYEYGEEVRERPSDRLSLENMNLDPNEVMLNARFFHKRIFEEVGGFDLRYRVGADWDLMIRIALHAPESSHVPTVVHRYRQHENQVSFGHDPAATRSGLQERLTILKRLLTTTSSRELDVGALRQLHSDVVLTAVGAALADRRPGHAATCTLTGIRRDPLFILRAGNRLRRRISARKADHAGDHAPDRRPPGR